MIVACPNCETRFNLPDENIQPEAQLRCSVCKHVFGLPDAQGRMPGQEPERARPPRDAGGPDREADDDATGFTSTGSGLELDGEFGVRRKESKRSRKGLVLLFVLLLLAGGAGAAWYVMGDTLLERIPFLNRSQSVSSQGLVSKITLRGVRQYSIANEKLGQLSVIEGKAVNGFAEPRELIRVEAALYDKDGAILDTKQQMGGTSVSLFQLQVLGEKELEQALGNRIEILSNNTNVPPGGEVPFMVVFYNPPENAAEFGVKVTDAKVPPQ